MNTTRIKKDINGLNTARDSGILNHESRQRIEAFYIYSIDSIMQEDKYSM
jgi:hypothetical protein